MANGDRWTHKFMQSAQVSILRASHKKGDTCMMLHAVYSKAEKIAVTSRKTNVFIFLAITLKKLNVRDCLY